MFDRIYHNSGSQRSFGVINISGVSQRILLSIHSPTQLVDVLLGINHPNQCIWPKYPYYLIDLMSIKPDIELSGHAETGKYLGVNPLNY
jgi:hypothetical protein